MVSDSCKCITLISVSFVRRLGDLTMTAPLLLVCLLSGITTTSESQFRFTQTSYNVSIAENSARSTAVTSDRTVGVYCGELCENVSYTVVAGDPSKLFRAEDRRVGDISFLVLRTLSGSLNRERKDKYVLTVNSSAVSVEQEVHESSATVVVSILDTNDLSPLFYSSEYSATVPEDLSVHSSIVKVFAEDADLGRNAEVYYSFLEVYEQFAVHPVTGVVTLMKAFKYSERSVYDLVVVARDRGVETRGGKKPSSTATVHITVTQVNLHSPDVYVYHLPEVLEYSHVDVYAVVRVVDRDDGVNGQIQSLSIVDGDEDGHFRVSATGGVGKSDEFNVEFLKMSMKSAFNSYNLTLRAVDKGNPSRTSYTYVPFKIRDYRYNKPIFEKEVYEIEVSEISPVNSSIIRLKIDERDGLDSQILLEIVGGNELGEFRINPVTGVLYTAVLLDAEVKTLYTLTVSAIDHGSASSRKQSSAKVKIQVVDMNDNDPQFESSVRELWISENEPPGISVLKVVAKDRDSGENAYISYSIANLNPVPFEIDHFTGQVRTTKVLDYESMRREYDLYIRASDWGTPFRRQAETKVRIKLKDVNDNKPLFEKTDCIGYLPRLVPIGTEIITLSAIDLDAGNIISYKIASGNQDGCFSLDVTSGTLSVACDLSEVGYTEKHINVTAYDGTHFADFARVSIKLINSKRPRDFLVNGESASFDCKDLGVAKKLTEVLAMAEKNNGPRSREEDEVTLPNRYGVNSHVPLFISVPNEVQVNESVPVGFIILKVQAVDRDLGFNGKLIFGISSGDVDSMFSMNEESGELRVSGYLDREHRDRYYLNISVFDLGQPQLSSSHILSIVILDVNDNSPAFDKSIVSFKIKEDILTGTDIFQFKASDLDLGENSHVWYEMVTQTLGFKIDSRSGMLSVSDRLDRESQSLYELKIKASDRASDPHDPDALHSYALARVVVEDVNDEVPMFPSQTYLVKIREDLPVGTVVVTVDAWDPDLELGGAVRYSISEPAGELPFSVDEETGTIRTTAGLDYEERQVYTLVVRGEDLGTPSLSSDVNVTIEVTDVNENLHPPRFPDSVFSVTVRENLPLETLVTTLQALDADPPGDDSMVSYLLVAGSGLGYFTIDDQGTVGIQVYFLFLRYETPQFPRQDVLVYMSLAIIRSMD